MMKLLPDTVLLFRFGALALSVALLGGCSKSQDSASPAASSAAGSHSSVTVEAVEVTDAQARDRAKSIERQVNFKLAEGLGSSLWASEQLLADPVALSMDFDGNAWVAVTRRSNNSEFDIRPYPEWMTPAMAMETVDDRLAFLQETFSAEKNLSGEDVPDRNEDGIHDWRDLAVVTEQVLRISDTTGDGAADRSQVFLEDFNTAVTDVLGGIYYHNELEDLFLAVAPNAWRVSDDNDDGVADDKQQLSAGFGVHIGFSGHGMSGMTVGPDGLIYYGIGDVGANIIDAEGDRHAYPNQGVIVRSEPDGSNLEVFARGVRNTHEFTFDKYGNLVSVDNDGDHPGEFERVVYLVDGSDSGWRHNWQFGKYTDPKNNDYKVWMDESYYKPRFEGQAAHLLPPVAAYHAGPTGMVYNPGTALSEKWKDHFFIVQYTGSAPRSGINAFTLEPEGAGFELASDQSVMRGVQSTGLDVGPDGALYTSDWIAGWHTNGKGRIWKLDEPDQAGSDIRAETRRLLSADLDEYDSAALQKLMAHVDMRVRSRGQFELAERGEVRALEQLLTADDQLQRIHAIWGIGQLAREDISRAEVLVPLLDDTDPQIRAQAAKVIGDVRYEGANGALLDNLKHDNARVRFFAAQALGRIGTSEALAPIVAMLADNNDEDIYLRQGGAIALARIGDEGALAALADHDSEAVRIAAVVALRRMGSPALTDFLDDGSEFVVTNAARAINDDYFVEAALPELAALLVETGFDNEPLVRRMINANAFGAGQADAQRLVQYAARESAPAAMRAEAIDALAFWDDPSVFDRVSGRHRGERDGNGEIAKAALADTYPALLADDQPAVREASARALGQLEYADAHERLNTILRGDDSADVRLAALKNLDKLGRADKDVVYQALEDTAVKVRMEALSLVPGLDIPVATMVDMHTILLAQGSVTEGQAALASLAKIDAPEAEAVLAEQLELLKADKLNPAVQLDLINAVKAAGSEQLAASLEAYEAAKDRSNPLEVHREALRGGDADNGRNLFRYSSTAQCVRCHVVGSRGNRVGPELTTIGADLTRKQLLAAMVDPGARIAPGFGRTTLTLEDGSTVEGLLSAESETHLTVVDSDDTAHNIDKADIVRQQNAPSGMPPMGLMLEPDQLRDLVAYLASLDGREIESEGH